MRIIWILVPILLVSEAASASLGQSGPAALVGLVTDWTTGQGIEGVTVEADDEQHRPHKTLTRKDGTYELKNLPKNAKLKVRCQSYGFSRTPEVEEVLIWDSEKHYDINLFPTSFTEADLHATAVRLFDAPSDGAQEETLRVVANLPAEQIKALSVDYARLSIGSAGSGEKDLKVFSILNRTSGTKLRVAVFPFDDGTRANKDMSIGTKVADQVIAMLASNGAFTVYDRQYVDRLLAEKNLKYDPNYDSAGTAKTGLIGTVDLVISGQIDAFSANSAEVTKNQLIRKTHEFDGTVTLKATARLISVEKGLIMVAPSADDEQKGVLAQDSIYLNSSLMSKAAIGHENASVAKDEDQALRKLVDHAAEEVAKKLSVLLIPVAEGLPAAVAAPK